MRVSDASLQAILLQGFQRAQGAAQERQIQLSTGDRFANYGGYGADAVRLLSAEGVVTRAGAYENAANIALSRFSVQEAALSDIEGALGELRSSFIQTLSTGNAELIRPQLELAATQILNALNTEFAGTYLFGGTDGARRPVAAGNLAELSAAANVDALFNEGDALSVTIEEGVAISGGPRASDVARDILQLLRDLDAAETTLGPFQGQLTDPQRAFIVGIARQAETLVQGVIDELGVNGVLQGQAADAVDRNRRERDLAEVVAAEIEDVDIAEAIARLNQDQLAVQASAQALAQATSLSLLNFL